MSVDFLAADLDGRCLGVPTSRIREVVRLPAVTRVPGAPAMIGGVMNLRGQLITAIDLRAYLLLPSLSEGHTPMAIVVEHDGHLYALAVDSVGDVHPGRLDRREPPPATLSAAWRQASKAVQRDENLVLILDLDAILTPTTTSEAA